jgi:hypothetical protein
LIVNLGVFTGVSTSDKLLLILKQIIHEIWTIIISDIFINHKI